MQFWRACAVSEDSLSTAGTLTIIEHRAHGLPSVAKNTASNDYTLSSESSFSIQAR